MAQTTKKKTVKDLNVDLVNLAIKVKDLEDLIKRLNPLSEVKDLDEKVKAMNENVENNAKIKHIELNVAELSKNNKILKMKIEEMAVNKDNLVKKTKEKNLHVNSYMEYLCTKCEKTFEKKGKLKDHISEKHPMQIKCKICSETFDKTHKLEVHLKKHDIDRFKCKTCDKIFQLKWRLDKHEMAHDLSHCKFCHYYNNSEECPYEEVGCMYKHETSPNCKFKSLCRNKLCQFRHPHEEVPNEEISLNELEEEINDSDSELEEDLECETCEKVFDEVSELSEHRSEGGCGYACDPCGAVYKYRHHLESHKEKHCIKCYDEFHPKSVLKAHILTCKGYDHMTDIDLTIPSFRWPSATL